MTGGYTGIPGNNAVVIQLMVESVMCTPGKTSHKILEQAQQATRFMGRKKC